MGSKFDRQLHGESSQKKKMAKLPGVQIA